MKSGAPSRAPLLAAAIIAGGQARRMAGADKTALLVGSRTILERQLELLRPRFSRVLLVTRAEAPATAPSDVLVVRDRLPGGQGPLAGIDAALAALAPEEEGVICVGGDMPLIAPALLELLRDASPDAAAVVPRVGGRAEPLCARYGRSLAPSLAALLASGARKAQDVLARLPVHWLDEPALRAVDPALASFTNLNTPDDVARVASAFDPPA